MPSKLRWCAGLAGGLLVFSLGLSGCGDDDDDSGGGAAGQSATGGEPSSAGAGQDMAAGVGNEAGGVGNEPGGDGGAAGGVAGSGTGSCDTTVIGSWKAGATSYESSVGLFIGQDQAFNFSLVACGGSDAEIEFEGIPMLAEGSYPLTFTILHGMSGNGDGGAVFLQPHGKNYFTDDTHTGTFTITAIDETAHKFSADFEFTGKADDGDTLEITEGHLIDAPFQRPTP